jgi:hypothetical protein
LSGNVFGINWSAGLPEYLENRFKTTDCMKVLRSFYDFLCFSFNLFLAVGEIILRKNTDFLFFQNSYIYSNIIKYHIYHNTDQRHDNLIVTLHRATFHAKPFVRAFLIGVPYAACLIGQTVLSLLVHITGNVNGRLIEAARCQQLRKVLLNPERLWPFEMDHHLDTGPIM